MAEPPRVAFKLGGFKRPLLNNAASSTNQFESSTSTNSADRPELVTGFDNGEIKSNAPVAVKVELVIPSQPNAHNKFFKTKTDLRKTAIANATGSDETVSQLDSDAKRALIIEAEQANEAWNERTENGTTRVHTIDVDMKNTFAVDESEGKDDEDKDVDTADYEQVPIEEFGMAVLRGMGFKEDAGLGITNKKQVDVFVPEMRPRGLGLGADRKVLEKINQLKRNLKKSGIDEKDDLCFEKGAPVLVENGPHRDQYGTIESIDEDVSRLTVALAISGTNRKKEVISISQYNVKLVTEKEFLKYSKYVNKSKAEKVEKETSDRLMEEYQRSDPSKRHRSSNHDDDDRKGRHSSSNGSRRR